MAIFQISCAIGLDKLYFLASTDMNSVCKSSSLNFWRSLLREGFLDLLARLLAGNFASLSLISCNFSCVRFFPLKPVYKAHNKSISGKIWLSNLVKSLMVKYLDVICEYSLKSGNTSSRSSGAVKTR